MVISCCFRISRQLIGTRDAFLRLLSPHISDSLLFDYLTAISTVFSSFWFSVALIIFQIFLANEITAYYPLKHFFSLYYIQVASNLDRWLLNVVKHKRDCACTLFQRNKPRCWYRTFFFFCIVILKISCLRSKETRER